MVKICGVAHCLRGGGVGKSTVWQACQALCSAHCLRGGGVGKSTVLPGARSGSPIWRRVPIGYSDSEFGRPVHAPLLIMFHVVGCCVHTRFRQQTAPSNVYLLFEFRLGRTSSLTTKCLRIRSSVQIINSFDPTLRGLHTKLDQSYVEEWRCRCQCQRGEHHTPTASIRLSMQSQRTVQCELWRVTIWILGRSRD
ncbi:hypothetical protein BDR03DRAFT_941251 [Suillus americanus]|nr:hypothetical protein BDR03DRAFT_941251 [Suillus americanus]